jgi:hypothetical protein
MDDAIPLSTDQPLPGLGAPSDVVRGSSQLYQQVQRSLRALHEAGQVDERHAGLMQLALELASAIRPGEKAYGVAQAAAQLLATFDKLMPDAEGGAPDAFAELRAFLDGVDAAGRGA